MCAGSKTRLDVGHRAANDQAAVLNQLSRSVEFEQADTRRPCVEHDVRRIDRQASAGNPILRDGKGADHYARDARRAVGTTPEKAATGEQQPTRLRHAGGRLDVGGLLGTPEAIASRSASEESFMMS